MSKYITPEQLPPTLTREKVQHAVERYHATTASPGFCLNCGASMDGADPDQRDGKCEICGAENVWGAEEIWMTYYSEE